MSIKKLIEVSFLSLILTTFSFIKLPGFIPGTEFQVSAPIAVSICAVFGFKKYLIAGVISSIVTFFLGTHNAINILNSFVFRIVAGTIISLSNKNIFFISISGPIGSLVSRFIISIILNTNFVSLLIPSIPGMIYTLLTSYPITKILRNTIEKRWF